MKPNFALSLSFDGLRLMHRVTGGWTLVGEVALDVEDLTEALARLRAAAETLEPSGIATKLLIPNDQIKYLAIDTTRAEDDDVRAALHGATPYSVDELAYDFAKGGGRTYVAAVARETLSEAEQFATEHGFNPVSFAAVPEPFTYVGEAFFGGAAGKSAERDDEPVIVVGTADVEIAAPEPDEPPAAVEETVEAETAPEPAGEPEPEAAADPGPEDAAPTDVQPDTAPEEPAAQDPELVDAPEVPDETPEPAPAPVAEPEPAEDAADAAQEAAPAFASLRADRNEGRPTPPEPETAPEEPVFAAHRKEPSLSRQTPPALAVPTGKGTDAMPPVAAPRVDDVPVETPKLTTDTPEAADAPAITGEAATALPADAAVAAASLMVEPDPADPEDDETPKKSAAATALGAATGAATAVGGMFASRRMARAEAKAEAQAADTADKPDEKSRLTVFGARKPAKKKEKIVVGGKPRFLGLILTAILLLFLLAIAAFAALSEEGLAGWFGFGNSDTQVAATDTADPAASEVAAVQPEGTEAAAEAPDALANPLPASELTPRGTVLSPEEAQRIYAATGVWQKAPRIPQIPRTTSLDEMVLGAATSGVTRVPPSPLASASSVAGDAVIATPVDPPAPDATFNFNADGQVIATPQGALTPDGILVIAGRPALNPPTRPGTVAPEVTPQDQLAAVIPEEAAPIEDAPEGVIIIAGRPAIEPPVRTGTAAPAVAPEAEALASGEAPLLATDGLLVLAGTPSVLPPVRPGTVATPVAVQPIEDPIVAPDAAAPIEALPEGLNLIAGPPPVLPPARPGTVAPQNDASVESLTADVTAALNTGTAQVPTADTRRPLLRPAALIEAAAAAANAPIVGDLTADEAASFRPRTRPAGLAPPAPVEDPEPEPEVQEATVQTPAPEAGLQIAPEIAAAVQAAANRPNPIVNPTAQAVAQSERPDSRPRNMARIVERAAEAQQRAATQVAAVAPRTVAPSGPTGSAVAQNATLDNAINLRDVNLIGIYGGNNDRRALVRLANGRYLRVTVGDRLDGGRVTAISSGALSYTKRGRAITLEVPG